MKRLIGGGGGGGGTPGGSDTQVQFNDAGAFGGSADLTWDDTGKVLEVGGDIDLDDGGTYTTTLQTITPTAARTISFPDATGTVGLVGGSSGNLVVNQSGAYAGVANSSVDNATGNITLGSRFISSLNGAASAPPGTFTGTWFTGGTATTTKPQFLIEPTGATSTAWATAGTGLGVNAASGFAGNLLDLQVNGTSQARVSSGGALTLNTGDATIYGVRVGRGGGAVATNTAVGASALSSNISGASNTAIGSNALRVNTANVNTAVGDSALYSCTTGALNVAVGPFALYSNVSGASNIAIGRDALYFNTAAQNIAIGVEALKATTTGANNLGIGRSALFSNTEGTLNTVIGARNAAYDNTTGSSNVVLGDLALRYNTTGSNNTCIGTNAGFNLTTGSNNTIIGNVQGTAGLANTVIIGAGATERLRIDSSGRLLVGTSTDTGGSLFQVNGNRIRIATAKTPASATDTGSAGEICWDADYIYVCTATDTWKRTAISTW
jgi:hypothetical protein